MTALRAAVIGLGMMGRHHVRVWEEAVDDVELVAVADPDAAARRGATRGRPVAGYADAEEMLARERPDLVSVVAPTRSTCRSRSPPSRPARTSSSRSRSPPPGRRRSG
jgi:predicted dehydrogenase